MREVEDRVLLLLFSSVSAWLSLVLPFRTRRLFSWSGVCARRRGTRIPTSDVVHPDLQRRLFDGPWCLCEPLFAKTTTVSTFGREQRDPDARSRPSHSRLRDVDARPKVAGVGDPAVLGERAESRRNLEDVQTVDTIIAGRAGEGPQYRKRKRYSPAGAGGISESRHSGGWRVRLEYLVVAGALGVHRGGHGDLGTWRRGEEDWAQRCAVQPRVGKRRRRRWQRAFGGC